MKEDRINIREDSIYPLALRIKKMSNRMAIDELNFANNTLFAGQYKNDKVKDFLILKKELLIAKLPQP